MVGGMDNTELTEEFLLNEVIAPVVLRLFSDDEWDSFGVNHPTADEETWVVSVVADQEAVDIPLEFAEGSESVEDLQLKLIGELRAFIDRSEFGQRHDEDEPAEEHIAAHLNASRRPLPNITGRPECVMRTLRIRSRTLRLDRRRCRSAHRRD
ncbi:hypothetical protein BAURA63_01752 [Brevibacterium aurantiacum]|uniref:Uncharacterized protein n=2 Tax=Brevibacterium aurantiacum TaxID=273384 RepID=A0A2H1KYQ8_BREAU|nr:hypothetical protein BAURA63_01752 [Brevibacterium aurantiacum]SMY04788.1 hypothetical protein BAURA86_03821 [Brevibacterium aurantiacum]